MNKLYRMTDKELAAYFRQFSDERRSADAKTRLVGIGMIIALALLILSVVMVAKCRAEVVDMSIIQKIESNGNPRAVSSTGARGSFQIMPCVLQEYNQYHNIKYSWKQMFDHDKNKQVASWYITQRIPALLRYYHCQVTTTNVIRAYNAGIRSVVRNYTPKETRRYLTKYNRLKEDPRG